MLRKSLLALLVPVVLGCPSQFQTTPEEKKVVEKSIVKIDTKIENTLPLEMIASEEDELIVPEQISPEYRALLDTIAGAEGADYNTLYGGETFSDFSQHPCLVMYAYGRKSTAAGRYQFVYPTYRELREEKGLFSSFDEEEQDKAALYLIQKKGVTQELLKKSIETGDFNPIWDRLAPTWASFPTSRNSRGKHNQAKFSSHRLRHEYLLNYGHLLRNSY